MNAAVFVIFALLPDSTVCFPLGPLPVHAVLTDKPSNSPFIHHHCFCRLGAGEFECTFDCILRVPWDQINTSRAGVLGCSCRYRSAAQGASLKWFDIAAVKEVYRWYAGFLKVGEGTLMLFESYPVQG